MMCGTRAALVIVTALLLGACGRDIPKATVAEPAVKLNVAGSNTMAPVIAELAKSFQLTHPGVEFDVQSGGSGRAIAATRGGTADIAMVARALNAKERDLVGFAIARDGIGVIVHRDNPVAALTSAQVAAIFNGGISNWKAIGGLDARISVVNRSSGVMALEIFTHYFEIDPLAIKASVTTIENGPTFDAVAADTSAVAYVSIGETARRAAAGEPVKLLAIDGVAASAQNVRTGKYPVSRSLTLVTRTLPAGPAKAFIEFALSPQAAPIIKRYEFIAYAD